MTARQRRLYWNRERNKAVKYINKYRGKFYNALQTDIKAFEQALQNSEQSARKYINNLLFSDGISKTMMAIIKDVAVTYAKANYNTLRKEKQFNTSEEWIQIVMEYLGTNFYDKGVLQIVQTSRAMMLDILDRGNREGWGYYDYARYISETLPGLNQNRADMIARTEVGRAIHAGTFVGADRSPFQKQKIWVAAKDNRTRGNPFKGQKDKADHWNMDGQTVDFNDKFVDTRSGSELDHPHDPQAKAVDVIRCRCTFAIINKRDKNGNLIRKNSGMVLPISRLLNVTPPPPQSQFDSNNYRISNNKEEIKKQLQNQFETKTDIKVKSIDFHYGMPIEKANKYGQTVFNLINEYKTLPLRNEPPTVISFESEKRNYGYVSHGFYGGNRSTIVKLNFGHQTDSDRSNNIRAELDRYNFIKIAGKSKVDSQNLDMATAVHEFAHFIATETTSGLGRRASYRVANNFEMNDSQRFFAELKSLKLKYSRELNKAMKDKDINTINNISLGQYASTNLNEFMAEGFTEYKLHSNPSKYAIQIGKLIDQYYKR
jgi:hypothetical protein